MLWVVGIALVVGAIVLTAKAVPFRAVALPLLLPAAIAIWIAQLVYEPDENRRITLIHANKLELRDLSLHRGFGRGWILLGTIENNSAWNLDHISLQISLYDCPVDSITADCEGIGLADVLIDVPVPAGQVRAINSYIYIPNLQTARHWFLWRYTITEIEAAAGS
jgi:hypothetical protein